jgi:hypothetical protein
MEAHLIYNPRSDVLHASLSEDLGAATAVPFHDLVILLSDRGELLAIDFLNFTGFVRRAIRAAPDFQGEALFEAVRPDLQKTLQPFFTYIGPLAAEVLAKLDGPIAKD